MTVRWDLFVLHADADLAFVRGYLLPALGLARDRVHLSSELPLGTAIPTAIQDGVTDSKLTLAIVSPAFLHDQWASYGEEMAGVAATSGGRLVPLLLADCALPLRLEFRIKLDCRDATPAAREAQVARLRALLGEPAPAAREIPCPYPGMRPFAAENAALFCGRTREVDQLVARLERGTRELYVIGPSGSGKSSLIAAGVLPRLVRKGPGVESPFVVRTLRPGPRPARALAAALGGARNPTPSNPRPSSLALTDPLPSRDDWQTLVDRALAQHPPAERLLVFIDQLEEIFTLAGSAGRRELFAALDALRAIPACRLILTVRADFFGALMSSDLWPHVDGSPRHEVAPLLGDALRSALAEPAARVGVLLEPALIERVLADAAAEPGLLAAVQETLVDLWSKRDRALITLEHYLSLGAGGRSGLAVALARRADQTYARLTPIQRVIARRTFLRLISFGEGRAHTRRRQPLSSLREGQAAAELTATLRVLTEDRLITVDDPAGGADEVRLDADAVDVDLSHEALINGWDRLRAWIAEHRVEEQRRRALESKTEEWVSRGRGTSGLLDDGELIELDEWLTPLVERELGLSTEATRFIATSRDHEAQRLVDAKTRKKDERRRVHEAYGQRRRSRRSRVLAIAATVAIVVAMILAWSYSYIRINGVRRQVTKQTHQLQVARAVALLEDGQPALAVPYLVAARGNKIEPHALGMWFQWATIGFVFTEATMDRPATFAREPCDQVSDDASGVFVETPEGRRWLPVPRAAQLTGTWCLHGGVWIATVHDHRTLQIWQVDTGLPLTPPIPHPTAIAEVAWVARKDKIELLTLDQGQQVRACELTGQLTKLRGWKPVRFRCRLEATEDSGLIQPNAEPGECPPFEALAPAPRR